MRVRWAARAEGTAPVAQVRVRQAARAEGTVPVARGWAEGTVANDHPMTK